MAGSHKDTGAETKPRRSRGEGAVYRIADGTWRASLVITNPLTGATARRAVRGRTQAAAVAKLDKLRTSAATGAFPSGETTGAYLQGWLESVRPRVRPATIREYRRHLEAYVIPAIGRVELTRLVPGQIEAITSGMLARGLAPATARHARTVLRHALGDAMRSGLLVRNVAALARPPRHERPEMQTLTAQQVREFLARTAEDPLGPLFALAVTSGLRQGELIGLEWRDVDLTGGLLTVRRSMALAADGTYQLAEPKTTRSRRTVNLPRRAADALRVEQRRQDAAKAAAGNAWQNVDGMVFTDSAGRPVKASAVSHEFRRVADELGFAGVRFHDLRHTAATLALGAGVGLKVVSDMLGHSTISITADTYAHTTGDQRREAADAMDRALS